MNGFTDGHGHGRLVDNNPRHAIARELMGLARW